MLPVNTVKSRQVFSLPKSDLIIVDPDQHVSDSASYFVFCLWIWTNRKTKTQTRFCVQVLPCMRQMFHLQLRPVLTLPVWIIKLYITQKQAEFRGLEFHLCVQRISLSHPCRPRNECYFVHFLVPVHPWILKIMVVC